MRYREQVPVMQAVRHRRAWKIPAPFYRKKLPSAFRRRSKRNVGNCVGVVALLRVPECKG